MADITVGFSFRNGDPVRAEPALHTESGITGVPVNFAFRSTFILHTANGVNGAGIGELRQPACGIPFSSLGFSGLYKIAGIAKLNSFPTANKLITLAPANNPQFVIAAKLSAADGTFLFDGIALARYTVQGYDLAQLVNGVDKVNVLAVKR